MTKRGNTDRRSFLKSGAVLAAPVAALSPVAALADDGSKARLARLEDERAIGELHRDFLGRINRRDGGEARELVAGGENISEVVPDPKADTDSLVLAEDGSSALGRYPCRLKRQVHFTGDSTIEQMARLQGTAFANHEERRVLETRFIRRKDGWAITKAAFV